MKTYVEHIVNYYPKHSGLHNYESSMLVELKKGYNYPKTYFFPKLSNWIRENIYLPHTICVVPSHKGNNHLSQLVQEICFVFMYIENGTYFIQNRYNRKPLHFSNYRSKHIIKNSLLISSPNVHGKHILLLDDIVTTGTTMAAIEEALLEKGALTVHCLAIGKTWHPKLRGF